MSFYSSPSCDGDPHYSRNCKSRIVSILPRLATGIKSLMESDPDYIVSILPRLATGISDVFAAVSLVPFLFFPVLRRGSDMENNTTNESSFYSSPSCDGDHHFDILTGACLFLFFPVLRRGSQSVYLPTLYLSFYSSPSCDGDPIPLSRYPTLILFLFFPVLRRGSYRMAFTCA